MLKDKRNNFPYIGGDYYSDKFSQNELQIEKVLIEISEIPSHKDEIEFVYIGSGEGELMINSKMFNVSEGMLILLMPYHVNAFKLKTNQTLKCYRLKFSIGLLLQTSMNRKQYLESMENIHGPTSIISIPKQKQKLVVSFCEEVIEEHTVSNQETETLNIAIVSFLIHLIQSVKEENIVTTNKSLGWDILEYLHVHHQEQLTITKIAEAFTCSTDDIKYHLVTLTKSGFTENLNRVRIRNAVALLQFDELSIRQISEICGYKTEANFYKVYKQLRGETPQETRKKKGSHYLLKTNIDAWEIYVYMQENYQQKLSLKEMAEEINSTEKQVNRLLKQTFNKSFLTLLTDIRLQAGRNILQVLGISIEETTNLVGFSSSKLFSQAFKEYYGETPKQFSIRQHQ